jgi:hypothetical protein
MALGKLDIHIQKIETWLLSLTCTKIYSNWIETLNVRLISQTTLGKHRGTCQDVGTGNVFLDRTPKGQEAQWKRSHRLHWTKKFLHSKIINRIKR